MKSKTCEQKLQELCADIIHEREHWKDINKTGCNDPHWEDGVNMNLTRNHIIYDRKQIEEICQETGKPLPEEYYLPMPPKVNNGYMANVNQKERVKRFVSLGYKITTRKVKFEDDGQLRFL